MDTFNKIIQLQKDLLNAQLNILQKYEQELAPKSKSKRTSNLGVIEKILALSETPLHISQIIESAQNQYNITLERDSIVSALTKKIKNNQQFIRVAPNTFALKDSTNKN